MRSSLDTEPTPETRPGSRPEADDRVEAVRLGLLRRGAERARVDALLADAPEPWWQAGTVDDLVGDVALLLDPLIPDQVRLRILPPVGTSDEWDLAVVAADQIGLLATTAEVAARHRLSITSARIATWVGSGMALQRLSLVPTELPSSGEPDWAFIGQHLHAALRAPRAQGHRTTVPKGVQIVGAEPRSDGRWIVEVTGPDEIGLLADVASLLTGIGADVVTARLGASQGVAHDTFLVRLRTADGDARLRALLLANGERAGV